MSDPRAPIIGENWHGRGSGPAIPGRAVARATGVAGTTRDLDDVTRPNAPFQSRSVQGFLVGVRIVVVMLVVVMLVVVCLVGFSAHHL
jgi:hypothetical protein